MARFDTAVQGFNGFQRRWAEETQEEISKDEILQIIYLLYVPLSDNYNLDLKIIRDTIRDEITPIIQRDIGNINWEKFFTELEDLVYKHQYRLIRSVDRELAKDIDRFREDIRDEEIEESIRAGAAYFIATKIANSTKRHVRNYLQDLQTVGRTPLKDQYFDVLNKEIKRKAPYIRGVQDSISSYAPYVKNGAYENLARSGLWEYHQWVSYNPLDIGCQIDGEIVRVGETFSNGLNSPSVHPNCYCDLLPVLNYKQ